MTDQQIVTRMIQSNIATLDIQNATLATNEIKDIIATITGYHHRKSKIK
jgi:hypothetical protein